MLINMKIKIKKLFHKFLSFFPSSLPIGMIEFNVWADSIIFSYDFPDNDSLRFAMATMILHADNEPKSLTGFIFGAPARRPKRYFALKVLKGMSNQIAGANMTVLKDKQAAAEAAAKQAAEESAKIKEIPSETI